jgi:hypothetical protein
MAGYVVKFTQLSTARLKGQPAGELPGTPTYSGREDLTGLRGNYGASKFRFARKNNLSENYSPTMS